MSLTRKLRNGALTAGALGALALGGSALADAASNNSSQQQSQQSQSQPPSQPRGGPGAGRPPDPTRPGGHVGANGQTEQPLPADVAAKVKAAAEKKVSGGTIERVETDVDHGSPYEAHVRKADGTELEVLVNKDFEVTAVNTMGHP